jgi:lipoyl(octanoyl) transferase
MSGVRTLAVAQLGTVEYGRALALQNALVAARLAGEIGDTLLLLEHPHIFTLGRGADASYITAPRPDVPIARVSRGGQVTYHGPGQLVGYPILKLEGPARDVGKYLRALEQAMIDALARCSIAAQRRAAMTGVWVGPRKIASIGVGIRRWVTYHGFALNVAPDLSYFDSIVPCGIEGCEMTSIAKLGLPEIAMADFTRLQRASFAAVFGYDDVAGVDPRELWRRIDSAGAPAEARS